MVKKLNDFINKESEFIHSPFYPEAIREGDFVKGRIKIDNAWIPIQLWRYSPFGIEFINEDNLNLKKGQSISVIINLSKDENLFSGLIVNELYEEREKKLAGVRTFISQNLRESSVDRREYKRWTCAEQFLPTGTAPNPVRYNDFILFRVDNISAGGLRIITSMRNKLVGIGQRLESTISLPLVGSVTANLKIKHIDIKILDNKEYLSLGTQLVHPDSILKSSLAEYLLNFADGISIQSLKEDDFPIKAASKWFDFTYVKTTQEYNQVLELRYMAYKLANKLAPEKIIKDMADEFDARARILIVKHKEKVVGSLRATFNEENDITYHGRYVEYPSNFPHISNYVEVTRVCTDPNFRGTDITYQLLAHLLLTVIKSGRRYIVLGASGTMIHFYEKSGWKRLGIFYKSESLANLEHELLIMDTYETALGKRIGVQQWYKLYSSLVDYMIEQELIVPSTYDKMRINMNRSFGNIFFSASM